MKRSAKPRRQIPGASAASASRVLVHGGPSVPHPDRHEEGFGLHIVITPFSGTLRLELSPYGVPTLEPEDFILAGTS